VKDTSLREQIFLTHNAVFLYSIEDIIIDLKRTKAEPVKK